VSRPAEKISEEEFWKGMEKILKRAVKRMKATQK